MLRPLSEINLEDISEETGISKYLIVNIIARRVRQIVRGDNPMIEKLDDNESLESLAFREFQSGKLEIKPKKMSEKMVDIADRAI